MKKIIFYSAAISLVALSACKKEYACECNITKMEQDYDQNDETVGDMKTTKSSETTIINDRPEDAEARCLEKNDVTTDESESNGITTRQKTTKDCHLTNTE